MAIAPTGAIYKTLTFDGVSSADFGVYITGEAVFNAPQRDVEMVTIPGRNGTFALDNGRFENIEVSYPAGIFADTEADFAEAVSEFRNFLCSRNGYVRLEDDYNASEYRMAVYKSGLEVTPALLKAGEFTLTFDCKPQRWLTSGEEAISVDSGDTITNPTLFEASPMLEVTGYGAIQFNGYEIELDNAVMGDVLLADSKNSVLVNFYDDYSLAALNTGDDIIVNGASFVSMTSTDTAHISITSVIDSNSDFSTTYASRDGYYYFTSSVAPFTAHKGTGSVKQNTVTITGTNSNGAFTSTLNLEVRVGAYYQQPNDGYCSLTFSRTKVSGNEFFIFRSSSHNKIIGSSTVSILGNPTYMDCDLGECYIVNGGDVVSLNAYVDLGSNLPTFAAGNNVITYDNTITDLKVVPRWWKI